LLLALLNQRLEQGKDIAVSSRSLGGFCKFLDLHIVTGVWNGVCNNPLLAFLGEYMFMLEEAIVEGYKHMWLELTVLKPDGSETIRSMDPTAAQFGPPQPIVTCTPTTPSPGSTIFLTSKKALKGQSTKSSSSSTTSTKLFQVGYTTTCIDFLVYRLCRCQLSFNPARLQVIQSSRIQAQQCLCSFQTYLPAGVWDKVF
jgi:hypothetical protein